MANGRSKSTSISLTTRCASRPATALDGRCRFMPSRWRATRAAKNALGPADGSRAMIDAIHHAAHRGRTRTLDAALDLLKDVGIDSDPQFLTALEAVLEVLAPSRNFVGFDVATGDAKSAADDFDALEKLRRLAFSDMSLFAE